MKKKSLKVIIAAMAITVMAGAFVGCGSKQEASNSGSSNKQVSGSITLAGSTALQPLAEQAGKQFTQKNSGATINVQGGGSGTGLKLVSEGTADIGNSDVAAETKLDKDKAKELVDHKVCAIGFAVVANSDVKVENLTKDQIQKIFTGEITNWKQVGGDDLSISVINRTKSSGTRATFKDTVMSGKDEKEGLGITQDSNGSVEKSITSTKGSISYLALSYITEDVKKNLKVMKIDGIEANKENITTGKYPFWSYEHMYTKGEAKDLAKAFIDYMGSEENKALVEKLGYIPSSDMKVK
ncbi:phosphate ABC transporter substrate-binding protein [Clostridiaceae bacterium UIB06]|uniref:Phosphate-binding protein n=1 Tax=Clostridium thailandense TaxID=2794346 RepID=A0A949TVV0_9CLOT|nr:phosphate ABC transporter substrate-binding protein [Clostridium thailandense]MBV7271918.1 phosphate ABC transporter substrate-binding protein [Clostridium thailandense]MCH5137144.1 phosphate ABC transporter substrate-binding protein [Clostridiaceae bacterium UIB06]